MEPEGNSKPQRRPPIPALTGLRFFAAFFILFAHAVDWNAQFSDSNVRQRFSFVAMYGMPLFFVLSGFVIHYNYRDLFLRKSIARATCEFAAARFARLYPLFLCFFLMAVCADMLIHKVGNQPNIIISIFGYFLTLTQGWWYILIGDQLVFNWIFPLSWSISTEMFFYAVYVAIVYLLIPIRGRWRSMAVTIGFAVAVFFMFVLSRYYLESLMGFAQRHIDPFIGMNDDFNNSFYRWFFYFSPYVRIFEFLLGCLAAQTFIEWSASPVTATERRIGVVMQYAALASLVVCGLLYNGWINIEPFHRYSQHLGMNFLCAPSIALILFCIARYETRFSRWMSVSFLVLLGEASYSIYITHTWTLRLFNHPPPLSLNFITALDALARVGFGIALTIFLSLATYKYIEVPGRIWCRRILGNMITRFFNARAVQATGSGYLLHPLRQRIGFTIGSLLVIALIALGGQFRWLQSFSMAISDALHSGKPRIQIVSATYGQSCKDFTVPPPYSNNVAPGNATYVVKQACQNTFTCTFRVSVELLGDPANSCPKDFILIYQCGTESTIRKSHLNGEANGQELIISCDAA